MPLHPEVLRSRSNPVVKRVGAVKAGREPGLLLLEGERLVRDAAQVGLAFELLLVREDDPGAEAWAQDLGPGCSVRRAAPDVLDKASALETSPGLLALCAAPEARTLEPAGDALPGGSEPLALVIAGVANPGNLGALARSAEAAAADFLVLVRGGASPWNPKALRGSMGSLLRLPVLLAEDAAQASAELARRGLRQVLAATRGGASMEAFQWRGPLALWVTAETGAPLELDPRPEPVTIPMAGRVESLNVTVAGSLLLFAAASQRRQGAKS